MHRVIVSPRPPVPFHPVLMFPETVVLMDLSGEWHPAESPWSIGRYGEDRGIYTQPLFQGGPAPRTLHLGLDLGGPVGVAVHAVTAGIVRYAGVQEAAGDYGGVLVTEHIIDGAPMYALWGHLAHHSLRISRVGRTFSTGDVLGWLGDETENGGWPPHLHFQLSHEDPGGPDMPGACSKMDAERLMKRHPSPSPWVGLASADGDAPYPLQVLPHFR